MNKITDEQPMTSAEKHWTKIAELVAARMKITCVESFIIYRKKDGVYAFEITPEGTENN